MAKKSTKKTAPVGSRLPGRASETAKLHKQLCKIDAAILDAVNDRAKLVRQIAGNPASMEGSRLVERDFQENPAWVKRHNRGPLDDLTVVAVFREILSGCRHLLRPRRVAHLGPQYSYSHLAAIQHFGQTVELVPVGTIAAVFEEVDRGHADVGLVPIENSTDGRVADTLDMFTRLPARICGEVELPIHHALLAKCSRGEVREVYSKPQAISQCRNWLAKHLPGARAVEVTSTSTAAELAAEKPGAAAIASLQAGIRYGLDVLAQQIEDNASNVTRFAVIGKEPAQRTGNDKTAIMFQLENRAGALAEALNIFKRSRVNLTWIESFPIPGTDRAYLFFVEMEGHENDLTIRRATAALARKAVRIKTLGSFPAAPRPTAKKTE
ncbi:MAG: prephenate dehydratase [Pirellulales bacterium]|nr:prephenate dehydratase [Pirellulales bacterium]